MHLKSVQETAIDPAITVKKENKIKLNAINRQGLKSGSFVGFITMQFIFSHAQISFQLIDSAKKKIEKRDRETARIIEILIPPSSKRKFTMVSKLSDSEVKDILGVQDGRKQKRIKSSSRP